MHVRLKSICAAALVGLAGCATSPEAPLLPDTTWDATEAQALFDAVSPLLAAAPKGATLDRTPLTSALASGNPAMIDAAASRLFVAAASAQDQGYLPKATHAGWAIPDRATPGIDVSRAAAAAGAGPAALLAAFEPNAPQYLALKAELARTPQSDIAKRRTLALNMERWRWMPRDLGDSYIFVNIPGYDIRVVRDGAEIYQGRVIVGTTKTPTPVFMAEATGVVLNPTWFVPKSIVAESVGALLKDSPDLAAQRGYYVGGDGGVRQRPGPGNALGQMKIVMPNGYSVYIHDTPNKALFGRKVRTLSHGCVRAENAVKLAGLLLPPRADGETAASLVAKGETVTADFAAPMPVYLTYFTAYADETGHIETYPDIYGRDAAIFNQVELAPVDPSRIGCPAN